MDDNKSERYEKKCDEGYCVSSQPQSPSVLPGVLYTSDMDSAHGVLRDRLYLGFFQA